MYPTQNQHPGIYVQLRFDLKRKEVRERYKNIWQFQLFHFKKYKPKECSWVCLHQNFPKVSRKWQEAALSKTLQHTGTMIYN